MKIYEDGKYYIGQFKENLKHGKGRMFYSNRKLMYDGDWRNDKREGDGKYIFENGKY